MTLPLLNEKNLDARYITDLINYIVKELCRHNKQK